MKILEIQESWIHTHFLTDAERLASASVRAIERGIAPVLRSLGIVFGVHLERDPRDPGIRVVLECRPGPRELAKIRSRLEELLAPIPQRPPITRLHFGAQPQAAPGDFPAAADGPGRPRRLPPDPASL